MTRTAQLYAIAAAFLLSWILPASAQDAAPDLAADSLFQRETLSGDWFGYRKPLQDAGYTFGADEIFDSLANPAGGQKQGAAFESRFEAFTTIDLATATGWSGAILHANAYRIDGRGLSTDDVGNLLTVSNIGATPATRLFTLWLQQSLFDDTVSIRVGQIAADDEFFVSQYASLFINSIFGWPSVLGINLPSGGPAYPLATPGIRARVALSAALVATTAVFNGDPAPAGPGDPQARDPSGTDFRLNGGVFWIGELAYSASLPIGGDNLPGTYKAGFWYHDGLFADQRFDALGQSLANPASSGNPAQRRGDFGGYLIADELLWRKGGTGDQGLASFLRLGASPSDRNLIEFHMDGGLSYVGLLPGRDNDTIGIGASYEQVSSARRGLALDLESFGAPSLPLPDFESAIELSYQANIAPWWVMQPDAQFIIHPGARLPNISAPSRFVPANALVLGVRTAISL